MAELKTKPTGNSVTQLLEDVKLDVLEQRLEAAIAFMRDNYATR